MPLNLVLPVATASLFVAPAFGPSCKGFSDFDSDSASSTVSNLCCFSTAAADTEEEMRVNKRAREVRERILRVVVGYFRAEGHCTRTLAHDRDILIVDTWNVKYGLQK